MLSTMNIGMIRGGHNANVVPSSCSLEIDRRLLPDETVDQAFAELKAVLDGAGEPAGSYALEFLTGTNGFAAPRDGPGIVALAAAIAAERGEAARFVNAVGVSDGRYYADDRIEIVNFGPGGGLEGHAANESVALSEMIEAALVLRRMVAALLGLGG
jgi:acetylornithine deacetylase/succinyl-diaminopimelate desuccinylase-like protein